MTDVYGAKFSDMPDTGSSESVLTRFHQTQRKRKKERKKKNPVYWYTWSWIINRNKTKSQFQALASHELTLTVVIVDAEQIIIRDFRYNRVRVFKQDDFFPEA